MLNVQPKAFCEDCYQTPTVIDLISNDLDYDLGGIAFRSADWADGEVQETSGVHGRRHRERSRRAPVHDATVTEDPGS